MPSGSSDVMAGASATSRPMEIDVRNTMPPRTATTRRMVRTSDSQPGRPRCIRLWGRGNIVIVITVASRMGFRI